MASNPTQKALAFAKKQGWPAQVVEKWNSHAKVRVDLFGVIDIVALDGEPGVLGIQATGSGGGSARRRKAEEEPRLVSWLEAGNRFEVWDVVRRKLKRGGKAWKWHPNRWRAVLVAGGVQWAREGA